MTRILRDDDILTLLDRRAAVELMALGYRADARGEVVLYPRSRSDARGVTLAWLGAALPNSDLIGFRSYLYDSAGRDRGEQVVALYRYSTMELKALFLGQLVGALRTGAAVVAAMKLAQPGLRSLGLIGTGHQARQVLACASAVFPLESVWAWSPNPVRRTEFQQWAKAELNQIVQLGENVQEVLRQTPAIALVTSSAETVVKPELIAAPRLLVSISAYRSPEIDPRLFDAARCIWTDSVFQAGNPGTLFEDPARKAKLRPLLQEGDERALRDLGATRIILNTGAAWEEVLLAESLLGAAERFDAGMRVDLGKEPTRPESA